MHACKHTYISIHTCSRTRKALVHLAAIIGDEESICATSSTYRTAALEARPDLGRILRQSRKETLGNSPVSFGGALFPLSVTKEEGVPEAGKRHRTLPGCHARVKRRAQPRASNRTVDGLPLSVTEQAG